MHGHGHSLAVIVTTADKLGEVRLDVPERQHGHSQKYDQIWQDVRRWPLSRQVIAGRTIVRATIMQKALSLFEKGPLALVVGEGFEPSTSGL
jgi:hypothetical protein